MKKQDVQNALYTHPVKKLQRRAVVSMAVNRLEGRQLIDLLSDCQLL
jgi:hypothetical protein